MVLIGLYCLKCTIFDQLIIRKIIKIVATRCQILTLKWTKIDFGWAPLGELTALPQTRWLDLRAPTCKGRGGVGRGGKKGGEGCWGREGRGQEGRRGREREGGKVRPWGNCAIVYDFIINIYCCWGDRRPWTDPA